MRLVGDDDERSTALGPQRLAVLIVGSCVSRDTFVFLDPEHFRLEDYIARQSLASGFGPVATPLVSTDELNQPFPTRDDRRAMPHRTSRRESEQRRRRSTCSSGIWSTSAWGCTSMGTAASPPTRWSRGCCERPRKLIRCRWGSGTCPSDLTSTSTSSRPRSRRGARCSSALDSTSEPCWWRHRGQSAQSRDRTPRRASGCPPPRETPSAIAMSRPQRSWWASRCSGVR